MKDINVRDLLLGMGFEAFDFVILRVPTTGSDFLIMLKGLDVVLLEMPLGKISNPDPRTGLNLCLGQNGALREPTVPRRERAEAAIPLFFLGRRQVPTELNFAQPPNSGHQVSVPTDAPKSSVKVSSVWRVKFAP